MFNPADVTLGQLSSTLKDLSIVGIVLVGGWKARGIFESVSDFFDRAVKHMDAMEKGMNTLLTNHITHIEKSVEKIARRQVRATVAEESAYAREDAVVEASATDEAAGV